MFSKTEDFFIEHSYSNLKMPSMHYHSTFELYYLESGEREYFVEDKFFRVKAGSFVLISPYKLHRTGGNYAKRILIGFSENYLKRTFSEKAIGKIIEVFDKILVTPTMDEHAVLMSYIRLLEKSRDETLSAVTLSSLLLKLGDCKTEVSFDDRISRIIEYINKNYASICSIDDIAKNFYVSKYHLCRMFKSAMKMTVLEYLGSIKIKNASELLKTTRKSITEIALITGFNSSAYFTIVFKKATGKSPSEYRKGK